MKALKDQQRIKGNKQEGKNDQKTKRKKNVQVIKVWLRLDLNSLPPNLQKVKIDP